jgi:hypothetical protein
VFNFFLASLAPWRFNFLYFKGTTMNDLRMQTWSTCFVALLAVSAAQAQDAPPTFVAPERDVLEARFAEQLTGAKLTGNFTDDARPRNDDRPLATDSYTLSKVSKLDNGLWLFQTRIQYGGNDVTIPITLPVEWAGDVPVIIVDNVGFPGLGTYTARVAFHGDRYFGTWQGANHGGHMFGVIEKGDAVDEADGDE